MVARLLLALSFLGLLALPSRAALLWGANGHPFYAYPGITVAEQLDYLSDLGMKSYRVNISGADKLPELVALVHAAKKRGIDILPVVTPDLNLDSTDPKDLYKRAFDLAVTLVTPLKNDVRVWELGNEMENYALLQPCEMKDDGTKYPCSFGTAGGKDPLDYYGPRWAKVSAVLKGLSDGVISVDPTIRKAMGTAGWGHTGAFARMAHDGIKWDISVWHGYGQDPEWAFKELARYGHPIWFTELNSPNGSQQGEQLQADRLKAEMLRLKALSRKYPLEAVFIYELLDETYWVPDSEAYMGLVHLLPKHGGGWMLGDPKPAYLVVKQIVRDQIFFPTPTRYCDLDRDGHKDVTNASKVEYGYCLTLGQAPSASELAFWTTRLAKGENPASMIVGLVNSAEFRQKYHSFGLTNGVYLGLIYQLLLGRNVDGYGYATYIKQLNAGSMSRVDLAVGITGSSEFRSKHAMLFSKSVSSVREGTGKGG